MPLVIAPLFTLNSQYRPNVFVMSMTSSDPLVLAQCAVVIDMLGVTSIQKAPAYNIGTTYYFIFDVAKVLQTYSAPKGQAKTSVFPNSLNLPYNQSNSDIHTRVGLIVSYSYNDPVTGLLTAFPTVDTVSTGYPAIAGTRQTRNWQTMGFDFYIMFFGAGTPFLTNAPNPYKICSTENAYLTYIPSLTNTVRVITRNSAGTLIDSGLFATTPSATLVPLTIGVGMTNLLTQTYFSGSVNMANPAVATYEIQAGQSTLVSLQRYRYCIGMLCTALANLIPAGTYNAKNYYTWTVGINTYYLWYSTGAVKWIVSSILGGGVSYLESISAGGALTPPNGVFGVEYIVSTPLFTDFEIALNPTPYIFSPFSELRKYNVIECCNERTVRLHWLNRLGGADAYTFTSKKKIEEKTKSETAQKPLGWLTTSPPATSYDKGLFKIHQEVTKEYEVESSFYDEQQGAWIAELLSSPEVYMETSDGLIAVVIQDGKITLSENEELLNVVIQFVEANYISVQSN